MPSDRTDSLPSTSSADAPGDPASRLLDGLSRAVAAKGYAATTIGDIVAQATVSKRTFYEHFEGKSQCFTALYERVSAQGLQVLRRGLDPAQPWQRQLDQALASYFEWMASQPNLIRAMFIDILSLGPEGLEVRRRAQDKICEFILATANQSHLTTLATRPMALAVIGAIHELVIERLEAQDLEGVKGVGPVAGELIRRLFDGPGR